MAVYLFDKDLNLMNVVTEEVKENYQEMELNGLIKATATVFYNKKYEKAIYFGQKDENNFYLYKIISIKKQDCFITFNGVHIFFDDLKGYIVRDKKPRDKTLSQTVTEILEDTGWSVGRCDVEGVLSSNFYHKSVLKCFNECIKKYNAEFFPRITFVDGKIHKKEVDLLTHLSRDYGNFFLYGDNLISVMQETTTDVYTAFIGMGKGMQTEKGGSSRKIKFDNIRWLKKDGKPIDKPLGIDFVEIKEATKLFGYPGGVPKVGIVEFSDIEDKELLLQKTYEYAKENARPKVQFKAKGLNKKVELGEVVGISRTDLNIKYKTRIFKIKKDFIDKKVLDFEFGDKIVLTISDRLKETERSEEKRVEKIQSLLDKFLKDTTNYYFNEDGYNYELKVGNEYKLPAGFYSFNKPIDKEPTKVVYMGSGKILIADSKDSKGMWKFRTAITPEGIAGSEIFANSITANKLASDVGQSLDLSSNVSITATVKERVKDETKGLKGELESLIEQNKNEINLKVEKVLKGEDTVNYYDIIDHNREAEKEVKIVDRVKIREEETDVDIVKHDESPEIFLYDTTKSIQIPLKEILEQETKYTLNFDLKADDPSKIKLFNGVGASPIDPFKNGHNERELEINELEGTQDYLKFESYPIEKEITETKWIDIGLKAEIERKHHSLVKNRFILRCNFTNDVIKESKIKLYGNDIVGAYCQFIINGKQQKPSNLIFNKEQLEPCKDMYDFFIAPEMNKHLVVISFKIKSDTIDFVIPKDVENIENYDICIFTLKNFEPHEDFDLKVDEAKVLIKSNETEKKQILNDFDITNVTLTKNSEEVYADCKELFTKIYLTENLEKGTEYTLDFNLSGDNSTHLFLENDTSPIMGYQIGDNQHIFKSLDEEPRNYLSFRGGYNKTTYDYNDYVLDNIKLIKKNIVKSQFVRRDEHGRDINRVETSVSDLSVKADAIKSEVKKVEEGVNEKVSKIEQKADSIELSVNRAENRVNNFAKEINLIKEEDRGRKSGSDLYFYTTEPVKADTDYKLIFDLKSVDSVSSVRIYNCQTSYKIKRGTNNLIVRFGSERSNINIDSGGDKVIENVRLIKSDGIDTQNLVDKDNVISSINLDTSGVKIRGDKVEIQGDVDISGDVIIRKINNTSSYTTISGDKIESGTIKGVTLEALRKIKIGSQGYMNPIDIGMQIKAPHYKDASYGMMLQFRGAESYNGGNTTPMGLFMGKDFDFNSGTTIYNSNDYMMWVGGRARIVNAWRDSAHMGTVIVSNHGMNDPISLNGGTFSKITWILADFEDGDIWFHDGTDASLKNIIVNGRKSSDRRLKENIKSTKYNALDLIKKLKFYEFDWKISKTGKRKKHTKCGIIADDLQKLNSELVDEKGDETGENNIKYIDDYRLLNVALKAIQELQQEVKELKEKLK